MAASHAMKLRTRHHKRQSIMYLIHASLLIVAVLSAPASAQPVVKTSLGNVTGLTSGGVDSFLGIQFASVGERFSRSTLITNANQTINATSHGPYCYQMIPPLAEGVLGAYSQAPQDEECLYLSIWRPSNITSTLSLPVMFWIHGGALAIGSGAEPLYDGSKLAKEHDVIVLTTNYRLGVFGFLVTNETTGEGGLNGIHDVINALAWVQSHIADFGGDPSQVTIFGESAGSWACCFLSVSPLAKGLFHRSIMQSGQCVFPPTVPNTPEVGYAHTEVIMNATDVSSIEELQDYPANELAQVAGQNPMSSFLPATIDGFVLPKPPFELYHDASSIVPSDVIIGSTSFDDAFLFLLPPDIYIGLASTLEASITQLFPEHSADIVGAYSPTRYNGNQVAAYAAFNGDFYFRCGTRELANFMSVDGDIFLYNFAHLSAFDLIALRGLLQTAKLQEFDDWASHASDVPMVFGTIDAFTVIADVTPTETDFELVDEMMTRWASFATTGNPNTGDYAGWEPVVHETSRNRSTLPSFVLQAGGGVMMNMDDKAEQCATFPPSFALIPSDSTSLASSLTVAPIVFVLSCALVSFTLEASLCW